MTGGGDPSALHVNEAGLFFWTRTSVGPSVMRGFLDGTVANSNASVTEGQRDEEKRDETKQGRKERKIRVSSWDDGEPRQEERKKEKGSLPSPGEGLGWEDGRPSRGWEERKRDQKTGVGREKEREGEGNVQCPLYEKKERP